MKNKKYHYNEKEKAELILSTVSQVTINDTRAMVNLLDTYTFSMLSELSKAIKIMSRGK